MNQHRLEAALMLNQVISTLWSFIQLYVPRSHGGSIWIDGPESVSSPLFDILTDILAKPLLEADTGLEPMGKSATVDERNTWPWWKRHQGSDWIPHGDYEPICLLFLGLLYIYLLSKKVFDKEPEGVMVTYIYWNLNSQMDFLRCHVWWMVQRFLSIPLFGRWDQHPYDHTAQFVAPQ